MNGENRPSFAERINQSIEARIEADKIKNTQENGIDLLKNSTVLFGVDNDEKRGELMERVFARYGKSDKSFQDMVDRSNNPNGNKSVAMADKDSFVRSVFMAINASVSGDSLVTDEMSAEDIDSYLPESCKGVGREIKNLTLSQGEADGMVQIGQQVSVLLDGSSAISVRIEVRKKINELIKTRPENSLIGQYATISTSAVEDVGEESHQNRSRQNFRPRVNQEGEVEGGVEMAWQVSPDGLASAMSIVDSSVRWQSYTPPEWFKQLGLNKDGSPNEEGKKMQARIEYMVMILEGGSFLTSAGSDLEKFLKNPWYVAFDNEKFTQLFNEDFKLVMSKMLNDLCEFDTDPVSGIKFLKYKEKRYKLKPDGSFLKGGDGRKVEADYGDRNSKKAIDQDVENKLYRITEYKDSLAKFLAEQRGDIEPKFMDRMNAYTAWNLFYMFGDSSMADRMRYFRASSGLISDPIRTLNPESKAWTKWGVASGDMPVDDTALFSAEYVTSPIGEHVSDVMKKERDLGRPISGNKTMREKIMDGTLPVFRNRMYFGFFDFIDSKNLYKNRGTDSKGDVIWGDFDNKGKGVTLSSLLMNHASFDNDGKLIKVNEESDSWSFGNNQVDFLKFFRDHQDAAVAAYSTLTSKVDTKNIVSLVRTLKDKVGEARGVSIDGRRLRYTTDPSFWANIIWGVMPLDKKFLSSDYIMIENMTFKDGTSPAYSSYVDAVLRDTFGLIDSEVDVRAVERLLGVNVKDNKQATSAGSILKTGIRGFFGARKTTDLRRELNRLGSEAAGSKDFGRIVDRFKLIDPEGFSFDQMRIYRSLQVAIESKNVSQTKALITELEDSI